MSPRAHRCRPVCATSPRRQGGFTLVELMVTVAIALFLLGGLVTIVQNVRQANLNQQALAQLQDQQRFAMTVLTDQIQQAGYYADTIGETAQSALPAVGVTFKLGQAIYGTLGPPDTLTVRYQTNGGNGMILCDGTTDPAGAGFAVHTATFTVVPPAGNVPGQLLCSVDGKAAVPLANGVTNMQVLYGVNRSAPTLNYNIDTYLPADQMNAALQAGGDWMNVTSVRVTLTFANPLAGSPGQQPTLTFERVVTLMGRAGVHS